MTDYFKETAQVRALGHVVWDWEKVDDQEQERVITEQVSIYESEANSRCGTRETSELCLTVPQAESSRLSMDVDQGRDQGLSSMDVDLGRDKQVHPIPEEEVLDTSRSRINYGGGFIEEQIPDLQITEVAQPVDGNLNGQGSPRNNQEAPPPSTLNEQNYVSPVKQDSVVEAENMPGNASLLQDQVSCPNENMHGGEILCCDVSQSPPPSLVTRDTIKTNLSSLFTEKEFCFFSDLCPPSTSSRREAAGTFFHLLQMEKERKIVTSQEEDFGPLRVQIL